MKLRSSAGFSLIEILVGLGLMSVMGLVMANMMQTQHKETLALTEKLAALDFQNFAVSSLASGSACLYALNNPTPLTFDSTALSPTAPQTITLTTPLYTQVVGGTPGPVLAEVGKPASIFAKSLVVSAIRLKITGGIGDTFSGQWEIQYDATKTIRTMRPAVISASLKADISTPTAARVIACQASAAATVADCNNPASPESSTNKPCLMQMYRCPKNYTTPPGSWASFGCLGQLQTDSQCENLAWVGFVHHTTIACSPAGKALLH